MKQRIEQYVSEWGTKGYIFKYQNLDKFENDLFCIYFSDCFTEKDEDVAKYLITKCANFNTLIQVSKKYNMKDFWEIFWLGTDERLDSLKKCVYNDFISHVTDSQKITD